MGVAKLDTETVRLLPHTREQVLATDPVGKSRLIVRSWNERRAAVARIDDHRS